MTVLSAAGAFALTVGKHLLIRWLLRGADPPRGSAGSIGVIGGADGPTAIFVATQSRADWLLPSLIVTALAGVAAIFFIKRSAER